MSHVITLDDATYSGLVSALGAAPVAAVGTAPVPVPTPGQSLVLPADFDGLPVIHTALSWRSQRIYSVGFDSAHAWIIGFTPQATSRPARIAGAEYGSQPVPRHYALIKGSDNSVVTAQDTSSTETLWLQVGGTPSPWITTLEAGQQYYLALHNLATDGGTMYFDLAL